MDSLNESQAREIFIKFISYFDISVLSKTCHSAVFVYDLQYPSESLHEFILRTITRKKGRTSVAMLLYQKSEYTDVLSFHNTFFEKKLMAQNFRKNLVW